MSGPLFLTREHDGRQVGAVASYDDSTDLVTVGTPEGRSKATQAGGSPARCIAEVMHRELLADAALSDPPMPTSNVVMAAVDGCQVAEVALMQIHLGRAAPDMISDLVESMLGSQRRAFLRRLQKEIERAS